MKEKNQRIQRIKDIISKRTIGGQEELLRILVDEEGYDLTQATLSRDLKALKVAKIADENGGYRYIIQDEFNKPHSLGSGFVSMKASGNVVVMRTLPGYANPLAVLVDNHQHEMLLGSIAGDDTIIFIMDEDNHNREIVLEFLNSVIKGN